MKADAPAITLAEPPTKLDSTKLLKERTAKFGAKAIFPALLVGAAGFFISSQLHGDGGLATGSADGKGIGVAGGMLVVTILAGYADHGRLIPENVQANKAAGEAFQKGIADANTENRRRVTEYKTVLTFDLGGR